MQILIIIRSEPYHTQSSHPLAKRANQIRMGNPDKSRPYPSIFTDEFATTTASTSSPTESVYFVTTSPCVTVPFIPAASDPVYRDSGNSRTSSKGGFSAGQIAGIIGGSILGGLALTSLGLWLCCLGPLTKAKRNKDEKADSTAAQPSTTPPLSDANQGERITIRTTGDPAQGETVYRTVDPSSASTAQQQPVDGGRSRNSVTPGTTTEAFPAMSGRNGMERAGGGDGAGQGAAGGQAGQGRGQGQGVSGSPVYYTRSPLAGQQVAQGPSIQEVPQNGRRVQARHDGAASEPVSESPEWWDAGLFV